MICGGVFEIIARIMKILDYKNADFWKSLDEACRPDAAGEKIPAAVASVISRVREDGDAVIEELTLKFDGVKIPASHLRVGRGEIKAALSKVSAANKKGYPRGSRVRQGVPQAHFPEKLAGEKSARGDYRRKFLSD